MTSITLAHYIPSPPTLWRYLIKQYLSLLALSLFGFLIILLSSRLEEMAKLVVFGASLSSLGLFVLYQIPYVFQVALPISSLIASLYLFQRLSQTQELTSLRASGLRFLDIGAPLFFLSAFLALFSFGWVFDFAAKAHMATKQLEFDVRERSPLTILHHSDLISTKGISFDMKEGGESGGVRDMIIACPLGAHACPSLLVVKSLHTQGGAIHGEQVSLISVRDPQGLVIENTKEHDAPLNELSFVANRRPWKAINDLLPLPLLMAKRHTLQQKIAAASNKRESTEHFSRLLARVNVELVRRLSLSLSCVSFTLVGVAFGTSIGRWHSRKRFLWVVLLAALFLLCYLTAKAVDNSHPKMAIGLFVLPHVVLIGSAFLRLQTLQRGIER